MRNGQLTDEEKARAVLARTGRPGNEAALMSSEEQAELAAIYDDCIAPEAGLQSRVAEFWARRSERLEAQKATSQVGPVARPPRFRARPRPHPGEAGAVAVTEPQARTDAPAEEAPAAEPQPVTEP